MASREELVGPMAQAIKPSASDLARATEAILAQLGDETRPVGTLMQAVYSALGATGGGSTYNAGEVLTLSVDPQASPFPGLRAQAAGNLALAKLVATGVAIPSNYPSEIQVDVESGNQLYSTRGPLSVPTVTVELARAYRLSPGIDPEYALPLTSVEVWKTEVAPLLSSRTERVLAEALHAAQRGLYQAALTLLGAVCESAWYVVGEAFRSVNPDLAADLDKEATAQVQRQVRDELAKVRRQRAVAGELFSHASYLRDIRNYGIHANSDEQESLEHSFTEPATGLMLLQTQRHLVRLLAAARAAGVLQPAPAA